MNKWLKLFLILLISAAFISALYGWVIWDEQNQIKRVTGDQKTTSSKLVLTLLTQEEAEKATSLKGSIMPTLPQLNDHLDPEDAEKYNYQDLVSRLFISTISGDLVIEDTLLLFDSKESAQQFIRTRAEEMNARTSRSFNGTVLTLHTTSEGNENSPPSATLRFAINNIVSKITVYGKNPTIDYTNTGLLGTVAISLATEQKAKIEQVLSGKIPELKTSMALRNFPDKISGTELIGIIPITQNEWLGETKALKKKTLEGFISGAYGVFKIADIPGHALGVAIIEFKSKEDALKEQQEFLTTGAHEEDKSSEELKLPQELKSFSTARISDTMIELQAVKGPYLYDIAIFAPYSELDKTAQQKLIRFSEEILK